MGTSKSYSLPYIYWVVILVEYLEIIIRRIYIVAG